TRALRRPAALRGSERVAAPCARPRGGAALRQFLSRRTRRARPVLSQGARHDIRRARGGQARRVRRADPPEGSRGMERAAVAFLLFRVARRRGRRLLRDGRGFRAPGHSVHAAHHSDQEVVAMANEKVDVVIVGGGASGILLAAKLGQAGKKVVILEMGPPLALDDLVSSQIWSRRLKWGGVPVVSEGRNPVAHNFQSGWGLGGAAMHQFANWPRFHPEDFRVKTQYGRGLDWPISYADLRPYYDRIQKEVGLSGDHVAEVWRPAGDPYPMPPIRWFRQAELLAEGFRKIGMRTAPMPLAINSVSYNGRPACIYDGWCEAGCPTGALVNPQVTYLPVAKKAGVEIRTGAYVTRVLVNAKGDRASGVEYYDKARERREQHADVVVLSAFSASNPRILLNSANDRHPKGLANSSGLVGHNVTAHITFSAFAMFEENTENHMGTSGAFGMSQDGYVKDSHPGFGSYTWTIGVAMKPNDVLGFANSRPQLFGDAREGDLDQPQPGTRALPRRHGHGEEREGLGRRRLRPHARRRQPLHHGRRALPHDRGRASDLHAARADLAHRGLHGEELGRDRCVAVPAGSQQPLRHLRRHRLGLTGGLALE